MPPFASESVKSSSQTSHTTVGPISTGLPGLASASAHARSISLCAIVPSIICGVMCSLLMGGEYYLCYLSASTPESRAPNKVAFILDDLRLRLHAMTDR